MPAVSLQPHYEKDTKYRRIMPKNKSAMTRYRLLDAMLGNPYRDYRMEDLNNECNRQLVAMGCPPVSLRQTQKDVHYLSSEMPGAVAVERYEVRHVSPDTGNVALLPFFLSGLVVRLCLPSEEKAGVPGLSACLPG